MNESIYEISYLLVPTLPQEKVGEQVAALSDILAKNSAENIAEESPSLIPLAYQMEKSSGGGAHQRFDRGYFGWIKFSCSPSAIEEIRKSFEQNQYVLRTLAISTIKESTYLGKRAKFESKPENKIEEKQANPAENMAKHGSESKPAASLTNAEIAAVDKELDEIVKGA